jgi:small subunit ribosomal protein S1
VLQKGQKVKCVVLSVDQDKKRVALGLKQMEEDPWERKIPEKYVAGEIVRGKVTKVTNFGVFVELEPGLEGLLHVSELADHKVESPEEVVKPGQDLEVKILRVDTQERKIGLSLKRVQWAAEEAPAAPAPEAPAPEKEKAPRLGGIQHVEDESVEAGGTVLFGTVLPSPRPAEEEGGETPKIEAEDAKDEGSAS